MEETKKRPMVAVEYDVEAQKELAVPLGEREIFPYSAMKFAEGLREQGVDICFGSPGGHIWALVDAISRIGINTITFGHEQNAVYAAEAYAQVSGKVGVVYATAGPGMLNTIPGINQAFLSSTPLIALMGSHDIDTDGQFFQLQEGYAVQVMGSMTKSAYRVIHKNAVLGHVTRAGKLATAAPRGPVCLEIANAMWYQTQAGQDAFQMGLKKTDSHYIPNWRGAETTVPISAGPGEPADIARAVELIQQAKAPAFLIGDGAAWTGAEAELLELVNLLKIPFIGRRLGKGVVSDEHPYAVRGKVPFNKETDLLIGFGIKVGSFDQYGRGWPKLIQIAESVNQVQTFMATPVAIVGNIKSVARHMLDYIKANNIQAAAGRDEWIAKLRKQTDDAAQKRREKAMYYAFEHPRYRKHDYLHFGYVAQATADYLQEHYQNKARVVIDGFTISDYAPPFLKSTRKAQVISSGDQGGVGHGVGMAVGAMFAQLEQGDRTPIIALMGDSGMGNAGPDIEVAARHNLPIVYLVTNNFGWMPSSKYYYYGKNWEGLGPAYHEGAEWHGSPMRGQERLPQDWAGVGRSLGLYAETCSRHEEFLAALDRCFKSAEAGKPAVLDCLMDPTLVNRQVSSANYAMAYAHLPYHEQPARGKAIRKNTLAGFFPALKNEPQMTVPDPWEPSDDE